MIRSSLQCGLFNVLYTSLDNDERDAAADEIQVLMAEDANTFYVLNVLSAQTYNKRLVFESSRVSELTPWLGIENWHFEE